MLGSGTKWTWDYGIITTSGGWDTKSGGGPRVVLTLTTARAGSENPHAAAIIAPASRHHHTLLEFPIWNLPSCWGRSSSVSLPHFSLTPPLVSFHFPFRISSSLHQDQDGPITRNWSFHMKRNIFDDKQSL